MRAVAFWPLPRRSRIESRKLWTMVGRSSAASSPSARHRAGADVAHVGAVDLFRHRVIGDPGVVIASACQVGETLRIGDVQRDEQDEASHDSTPPEVISAAMRGPMM